MSLLQRLNGDTLLAIRSITEEKMRNQECFFALDVTNEVKQRGYKTKPPSNFGSHARMAPLVTEHARDIAPIHNYAWALLDVGSGQEQAWLYFPNGTSTAAIQGHVNRRVTPLIPVDVWAVQVAQQGSGVQSQVVAPVAPPTRDGRIGQFGQHVLRLIRGDGQ